MGIDNLDGEVRIVPAKSLLASSKNSEDAAFAAKTIQQYLSMLAEQKKQGYVREPEPRAKELLEFHHVAPYQFKKYEAEFNPESTHLRHTSNELKMAYVFVGVPDSEMDNNIGVAPYGAYKQATNGVDKDGWDGAVQFFDKRGIGSCAFTEHNIKIAHGGVELIKELVSYDVHNKPTVILVKGNEGTGFTYKISWYDTTFSRELECANKEYSPTIKEDVIALANKIDAVQ